MAKKIEEYRYCVLVGGGVMAERLYPQLKHNNIKLVGVADLLPDEKRKVCYFQEFQIKHAKNMIKELSDSKNAIIVAINGFYVSNVVETLVSEYGIEEERIFAANPYTTLRPCVINEDFAKEIRIPLSDNRYKLVKQLFNDRESNKIYDLLLESKSYDNIYDEFELRSFDELKDNYYFSEDYWLTYCFDNCETEGEATVMDCGAYIGDSIEDICNTIPENNIFYYALEPEPKNAESIRNNPLLHKYCKELKVFECGVGNENRKLCFAESDNKDKDAGRFVETDDQTAGTYLDIRKLDDIEIEIHGQLYIKMDIEGFELSALKGATELIRKYKPFLAICVYHRKNDILDIPLFLHELVEDYTFYLRGGFHTILWAIPQ